MKTRTDKTKRTQEKKKNFFSCLFVDRLEIGVASNQVAHICHARPSCNSTNRRLKRTHLYLKENHVKMLAIRRTMSLHHHRCILADKWTMMMATNFRMSGWNREKRSGELIDSDRERERERRDLIIIGSCLPLRLQWLVCHLIYDFTFSTSCVPVPGHQCNVMVRSGQKPRYSDVIRPIRSK